MGQNVVALRSKLFINNIFDKNWSNFCFKSQKISKFGNYKVKIYEFSVSKVKIYPNFGFWGWKFVKIGIIGYSGLSLSVFRYKINQIKFELHNF